MDIMDYINSSFIGTSNAKFELTDGSWQDSWTTARATRDAYIKATDEFVNSAVNMAYINWNDTTSQNEILNDINNDLYPSWNNFAENFEKFWNTVNGVGATSSTYNHYNNRYVTEDMETPNLSIARFQSGGVTLTPVDLTSYQTFTEQIWNDYVDSLKEFKAAQKRFFAKYANMRIPESGFGNDNSGFSNINLGEDITQ